jgi:hypothetical protein
MPAPAFPCLKNSIPHILMTLPTVKKTVLCCKLYNWGYEDFSIFPQTSATVLTHWQKTGLFPDDLE